MTKSKSVGALIIGCAGPSLTDSEVSFLQRYNPWGLIVFKRNCENPEQLKRLTTSFRTHVGRRNAPVFIDQEGGRVQRMGPLSNVWRKYPAARRYGELYEHDQLAGLKAPRSVGRLMAEDLIEAGITCDCVPVLDVPQPGSHEIISDRAYATAAERVALLARAHIAGLMEGGVLPVMKHIPGHGRARIDSHVGLPVVDAPVAELAAVDFLPFAAFADMPMAMTAHVVYSDIDPALPATLSRKVISSVIRKTIGFDGLLMTDDLSMRALQGSFAEKVKAAQGAGCDIVLHCNGNLDEMTEVAEAAGPLKGRAMTRARAALRRLRKPGKFDRRAALKDLERLEKL